LQACIEAHFHDLIDLLNLALTRNRYGIILHEVGSRGPAFRYSLSSEDEFRGGEMGRFHLQFEDQNNPPRERRDFAASLIFIVKTSATIFFWGIVSGAVVSYFTGYAIDPMRLTDLV
jgi:hypothetical protein